MNKHNEPDKFYDYVSEDMMLAAAAASSDWARSPDFQPTLLTAERRDLAKIMTDLAIKSQEICEANVLASTADQKVVSAWNQARSIPNPPSGAAILPVLEKLRTLKMRRAIGNSIRSLHGEIHALEGAEILTKMNEAAIGAQEVMDSSSTGELKDGTDFNEIVAALKRKIERPGELAGMSCGFPKMDLLLDGLQPGRLITLAGRPHTGKTTVAMAFLLGAVRANMKAAFFSGEMTASQIQQVMLDMISGVTIKPGQTPLKHELQDIQAAMREMKDFNWKIDDGSLISIDRICAKARFMKHRSGLDIIFVDYIQLIRGSGKSDEPRLTVIEVTGKLKALSKELGVPVVALCQINRGQVRMDPETGRPIYGRPSITHLKESSSIESDSDCVIMIHRELENEGDEDIVDLELIIGKNRMTGIMTDVPCKFDKRTRAITEMSHLVRGV